MIRQMQEVDFKRTEEIWHQESVRVHNWMRDPQSFWQEKLQDFRDVLKRSNTKIVYDEDNIVKGFIVKYENNYIPEIFVDHQYRTYPNGISKEIGHILIDHLKASNSNLAASVYMLNHNAVKFYIKNNFVITKMYAENETGFAKFLMEWKE